LLRSWHSLKQEASGNGTQLCVTPVLYSNSPQKTLHRHPLVSHWSSPEHTITMLLNPDPKDHPLETPVLEI
jgi:hypothetical protein